MNKGDATTVLVVEDEAALLKYLAAQLKQAGYNVEVARDGEEGLERAELAQPELVVLDLGLPRLDGAGFLKRFREWSAAPVIILSAHGEEKTKIAALDLGADDYLTKPFSINELLARIRAALRRVKQEQTSTGKEGPSVVQAGELTIDLVARIVKVRNQEVSLTRTEYQLLRVLAVNIGKIITHRELLQQVWGPEYGNETEYLRTFIKQLRRKVEPDPSLPRYILTQPGVGYRFHIPDNA